MLPSTIKTFKKKNKFIHDKLVKAIENNDIPFLSQHSWRLTREELKSALGSETTLETYLFVKSSVESNCASKVINGQIWHPDVYPIEWDSHMWYVVDAHRWDILEHLTLRAQKRYDEYTLCCFSFECIARLFTCRKIFENMRIQCQLWDLDKEQNHLARCCGLFCNFSFNQRSIRRAEYKLCKNLLIQLCTTFALPDLLIQFLYLAIDEPISNCINLFTMQKICDEVRNAVANEPFEHCSKSRRLI